MGTRNITAVFAGRKYRVAQYGQWDGYPEGQGATVLSFLRKADLKAFKAKAMKTKMVDAATIQRWYQEAGAPRDAEFISMDVVARFRTAHPTFDRDMGADVLKFVADSPPGVELQNSIDFVGDSLFCEWAYVVDLDKGTFEVYEGFNEKPLPRGARFAKFGEKVRSERSERNAKAVVEGRKDPKEEETVYYPVKMILKYDLKDLPTVRRFLADASKVGRRAEEEAEAEAEESATK